MAAANPFIMEVDIELTETRCLRALKVIRDTMEDIAEDFEYRDDVKNAIKACRYLFNHVQVVPRHTDEN